MKHKLFVLYLSIWGELIKLYLSLFGKFYHLGINHTIKREEKIIVSLTSYGRRVSSVLPYTIISLLKQTCRPDNIVLWLDNDNWNDTKLPKKLKELQKYGLTINYCSDLKSYKKLIPTLEAFPNELIITCDDDLYYKSYMIKDLIDAYRQNPNCIHVQNAHMIQLDSNGDIMPYDKWMMDVSGRTGRRVFPTGGSGCLYHKNLLFKDVCTEKLFMSLAPNADDVWFYFMALLKGTTASVLPHKGIRYIPLDNFYQIFHKGSNLTSLNVKENQNDIQIRAILDHYGIHRFQLNEETHEF